MKTKYMALLICAALLMAPVKTALAAQEQTAQPVWTPAPQTGSAPAAAPDGAAEESGLAEPAVTGTPVQTAVLQTPAPAATVDPRDAQDWIVLGENLTPEQKNSVLALLGVADGAQIAAVTVGIQDEKALLGALVSADKIGTRSLSSARITMQSPGSGIDVTCCNITYVTPAMYASALLTAGVQDAKVVVAAPVPVSGTAALAGIFKGYEIANNLTLDRVAKAVASEELLLSGELAEFVGSDQAVALIAQLKQMVLENGWDNEETIRPALMELLRQLGVSLSDEQINQVVALALKFCSLDMEPEQIASQLQTIVKPYQKAATAGEKVQAFFSKAVQALSGVVDWVKGLFGIS
jgi:uncharacterized protein YpuA (DUF1002 family)